MAFAATDLAAHGHSKHLNSFLQQNSSLCPPATPFVSNYNQYRWLVYFVITK